MTARDTIAAFLKVRDENVTPHECDDLERADSADAILEALAAANVQQARIVREAVADLFIAADLLHERWKAQSKAVSRRLVEHAENLQEVLAGLSAITAAGFTIVTIGGVEKAWPSLTDAVERLREAAHRDNAITISVRAQDLRNVLAALASPHMPVPAGVNQADGGPVPTHECPFHIGQPVRLANPYAEEDPEAVFYVTGISWEHRMVRARGWNIMIASKEDIEKGYGQTDGFAPDDLLAASRPKGGA